MEFDGRVVIVFTDGTEQEFAFDTIQSIQFRNMCPKDTIEIVSEPVDVDIPEPKVGLIEKSEIPEEIPIPLAPTEVPEPEPLGLAKDEPVTIVLTARDVLQDESLREAFAEASKATEESVEIVSETKTITEEPPAEVCQDNESVADRTFDNSVLQHIVKAVVVEPAKVGNMDEAIKVVSEGGTAVIETEEVTVEVSPSVPDEEPSTEFIQV